MFTNCCATENAPDKMTRRYIIAFTLQSREMKPYRVGILPRNKGGIIGTASNSTLGNTSSP